ncbi:hypothetical protein H9Q13_08340 [Pontibacter sp. JH31]|uniref:YcxB-like protein domain-containing protein n=1 Tax=Pontibacter aquaedesilientis TaxID=2766980 RepID=A0ABR7XFU4_9BACT|nr:hypothetical protein [Pontibacter aquaedesilientis]MBD1397169.1 hypothetical protein [Pontibacter aquaedesilientis]
MKYQIDIQRSKATRRLKRKISMVELLSQYFLLTTWVLAFPTILGSMYFNAFRADPIVEVLFFLSVILSCGMLYSILTSNKLYLIHGLTAEQNHLLSEKVSKKLDWINSRRSRILNVFFPKWSRYSTHYGREVTVIYDSKEVLINSTTFLRYDLISPFHWFADRSVEKKFKTEFEKEVEKHRYANKT